MLPPGKRRSPQGGDHRGGEPFPPALLRHGNAFEYIFLQRTGGCDVALAVVIQHRIFHAAVVPQALALQKGLQPPQAHAGQRPLFDLLQVISLQVFPSFGRRPLGRQPVLIGAWPSAGRLVGR